ncbi:MAG: polysaccharide pyruvyl transferase family protein [Acidimicrobiia bacterium]|nr:polysaccharide pyruvyl transferase family protein [Acidimicrobiia bacterium]
MNRDPSAPIRVATLGAAFSGNQGAAAMLEAVTRGLPRWVGPCRFSVLSTHPGDDRRVAPDGVDVVPFTAASVIPLLGLALLSRSAALVSRRLARWLGAPAALRALAEADVVVDVSGISMADSRGLPRNVYHFTYVLIPLVLGRPVVKASQALGPFRRRSNRLLARLVLPRLDAVCARGAFTEEQLRGLGLRNVERAADLAFSVDPSDEDRSRIAGILSGLVDPASMIAVSPSSVVALACRARGIDYAGSMAGLIDHAVAVHDRDVVLFAHSTRPTERMTRMNDRPVCAEILHRVRRPDRCHFLDEVFSPGELRALIDASRILVTSRFHAMVSALATATPCLVVGWSHKYAEVLEPFGLADWAVDHSATAPLALVDRYDELEDGHDRIRARILDALPRVRDGSERNFAVIARVLHEHARGAAGG